MPIQFNPPWGKLPSKVEIPVITQNEEPTLALETAAIWNDSNVTPKVAADLTTSLTGENNDLTFTAATEGSAGNSITIAFVDPEDAVSAATLTTAFDGENNDIEFTAVTKGVAGNSITVAFTDPGEGTTASALTTSLAGDNNDLVFTARDAGTGGDDITVEYIDPQDVSQSLDVVVVDKAISVLLATDGSGIITTIAGDIITAISTDLDADALVTVASADANNGTGLVTAMTATNLSGGADSDEVVTVVGSAISVALAHDGDAIISTAADVIDAITNSVDATALITAANAADNTGAGLVPAMTATNLSGGEDSSLTVEVTDTDIVVNLAHDGTAITTTAADIITAIEADEDASALVTVENATDNTGVGLVTALAETALSGGGDDIEGTGVWLLFKKTNGTQVKVALTAD